MASQLNKRKEFESIALVHLDALYGAAMRLTRNRGDAEDLVQESMLRAYRFWDSFKNETSAKAWLFRIQTNYFFSEYKRKKRRREVTLQAQQAQEVSDGVLFQQQSRHFQPPDKQYQNRGFSSTVQDALDSIKDEYRIVVILCDVSGFSYKEIADIVDCPVGTVMSRLHRGRKELKRLLREHASNEGVISLERYRKTKGDSR